MTTPESWAKFINEDFYEAESLHTEGFIHGSYAEQLEESLQKYFIGIPKVIIMTIEPSLLTSRLVIEKSRNDELFPHIYGAINKSAITHVEERLM